MKILPLRIVALATLLGSSACSDRPAPLAPSPATTDHASPLLVPAVGVYTQISQIGADPMCALRSDGVVRCFGATTLEKTAATGVFTLVRVGQDHACAIRSDGAAECWGDNFRGGAPPVVVPPTGTTFTDLGLGYGYTCGVRSDGVIQCWGLSNSAAASAPEIRPSSGLFVGLSVGHDATCGITTSGGAECFGGVPAGLRTWQPQSGSFLKLIGASSFMCGIRTGGVVECHDGGGSGATADLPGVFTDYAGINSEGCGVDIAGVMQCHRLVEGDVVWSSIQPTSGRFTQVTKGFFGVCGLRSDGVIQCSSGGPWERVLPTATFVAPLSVIVGQPIPLALTNAQVPGYPAATTFTYAFDCGSGSFAPSTPGSASTTSCPTSTAGTRVVRGKVVDTDDDEAIYTATVTIKSAPQATSDLLTAIQLATLSPDLRKALTAKLDAALAAIAKGKTAGACSALRDFVNQVNAQRGKAIPVATADAWILTAQQLQAAIGC